LPAALENPASALDAQTVAEKILAAEPGRGGWSGSDGRLSCGPLLSPVAALSRVLLGVLELEVELQRAVHEGVETAHSDDRQAASERDDAGRGGTAAFDISPLGDGTELIHTDINDKLAVF